MRGAAAVIGVGLAASLALNAAQAVWQPAADAVSGLASRLGIPAWRVALEDSHQKALDSQRRLTAGVEAKLAALRAVTINFRGRDLAARDAVLEVATEIDALSRKAAQREADTAAAEALPVLGIAVLAEAKAAAIADDCATATLLWELAAAFPAQGGASLPPSEICGTSAPDKAAIMDRAQDADAVWAQARDYYPALPELMPASAMENLAPFQAAIWDWAFSGLQARIFTDNRDAGPKGGEAP